jgi:hypothetical protein
MSVLGFILKSNCRYKEIHMRFIAVYTSVFTVCASSACFGQSFPTEAEIHDGALFLDTKGALPLLEYCKNRFSESSERIVQGTKDWTTRNAAAIERGRILMQRSDEPNAKIMNMSLKQYHEYMDGVFNKSVNDMKSALQSKSDLDARAECSKYELLLAQ